MEHYFLKRLVPAKIRPAESLNLHYHKGPQIVLNYIVQIQNYIDLHGTVASKIRLITLKPKRLSLAFPPPINPR